MPVRSSVLGTSLAHEDTTNGVTRTARPTRTSNDFDQDSQVLARKPAKRRRKTGGLDQKLSRMLHRANASYAAMNVIADSRKRQKTTLVGPDLPNSYEVPRTPVNNVHDVVVSQKGRIGQDFRLIKLAAGGSTKRLEQANENVFSERTLPSWSKYGANNIESTDNKTKSSTLPTWLANTFSKLQPGHPLKTLVEYQEANSRSATDHHEEETAAQMTSLLPGEESVFAYHPPSHGESSTVALPHKSSDEECSTLVADAQPFSIPGPAYHPDLKSFNPLGHSTPVTKSHPQFRARVNMDTEHQGDSLPFSTRGPASSFAVSPPHSVARHLRFDLPDSDLTAYIGHTSGYLNANDALDSFDVLTQKENTTLHLDEVPDFHASDPSISDFKEGVTHGSGTTFDQGVPQILSGLDETSSMATTPAQTAPNLLPLQASAIQTQFKAKASQTKSTQSAGEDDNGVWVFNTRDFYNESIDVDCDDETLDLLDQLENSQTESEIMFAHRLQTPRTPVRRAPTAQHSSIMRSNRISTACLTSSPIHSGVSDESDPFVVKGNAPQAAEKITWTLAPVPLNDIDVPVTRRNSKFKPALIDEVTLRQYKMQKMKEIERTKTPVKEDVERFIREFGSDESLS